MTSREMDTLLALLAESGADVGETASNVAREGLGIHSCFQTAQVVRDLLTLTFVTCPHRSILRLDDSLCDREG